mgnify:CR=1 FL=1
MSLDFTKPVQTRDGRKVRILCTDAHCTFLGNPQPIVGFAADGPPMTWSSEGVFDNGATPECDLINVPPPKTKVEIEVRLYRNRSTGQVFSVAVDDPEMFRDGWLASTTVEMEYEEQS